MVKSPVFLRPSHGIAQRHAAALHRGQDHLARSAQTRRGALQRRAPEAHRRQDDLLGDGTMVRFTIFVPSQSSDIYIYNQMAPSIHNHHGESDIYHLVFVYVMYIYIYV